MVPAIVSRHHEASALLASVRDLVVERPAGAAPPSWALRRGWAEFLAGLSEDLVCAAERDGLAAHVATTPGVPAELVALAEAVRRVTELPGPRGAGTQAVAPRRASPRKRAQVAAFAALVATLPRRPERVVDVGSGHGHLTRHLARIADVPVEGWERDPTRVAVAAALATPAGGSVRFVAAELRDAAEVALSARDLVVGLHACGELSDLAVRAARQAQASIAVVGCCLQKRPGDRLPLVAPPGLDAAALTIPRAALGLANMRTGEEGVEADLVTRRRARLARFVVGRALAAAGHPVAAGEELRGVNRRRASGDLTALARRVFEVRGLPPPTRATLDELAQIVGREFALERRWALPRAMLGRAIEVWVALDRAAFLVGGGYEAEVRLAFDASTSPRNVALLASHPSAP